MVTASTYGSALADGGVGPHPSHGIVVSGRPEVQYLNLETPSECYPSRLVAKGTHDNDLAVCGAGGKAIGVLGYEQAAKKYRPATRATIYQASDQVPVLSGPGTVVLLTLADGVTVVKGDKLVAAADGKVTTATAAKFATSTATAVLGASASPTVAGSIPTEGVPVAVAEESVITVDVLSLIAARLLI